jgi:hypothetical protein
MANGPLANFLLYAGCNGVQRRHLLAILSHTVSTGPCTGTPASGLYLVRSDRRHLNVTGLDVGTRRRQSVLPTS